MKQIIILAAVFVSMSAIADYLGPPLLQNVALSLDGSYVARIDINSLGQDPRRDMVVIHEFDESDGTYKKIQEIHHSIYSSRVFVSNGGKFTVIAEVGRGSSAITIYNSDGEVVISQKLTNLLSAKDIRHTMMTGSTFQWLDGGSFDYGAEKFYFWGSAHAIKTIFEAPWNRNAGHDHRFEFVVDLEKKSIERTLP